MTTAWVLVVIVGVVTVALKGAGPLLLGGRSLPAPVESVLALLAPAMLAALLVIQTVTSEGAVVLDARLAGVGAAAVALALRAPLVVAVLLAAVVAAAVRALGM